MTDPTAGIEAATGALDGLSDAAKLRLAAAAGIVGLVAVALVLNARRPAPAGVGPSAPAAPFAGGDWQASLAHLAEAMGNRLTQAEDRLYRLEQRSIVVGDDITPPA